MSEIPHPPPPPAPPDLPPPPRIGRLVAGVLLVLIGIGWLLDVLDVTDFPWEILLPSALVLVGGALLVTSRSPTGHAGLIATGVVLSVVLMFGSALDFPIGGGVGDRVERPAAVGGLEDEYRLGVGRLTLDLTSLPAAELADAGRIRARVGIGELLVIVPQGVIVRVEARASLGNVRVFGVDAEGFDVERIAGLDPAPGGFELVLSVGLGEVEVRDG